MKRKGYLSDLLPEWEHHVEAIIQTVRIQIGETLSNFAGVKKWSLIKEDIDALVCNPAAVDLAQVCGGSESRLYELYEQILWKESYVSKADKTAQIEQGVCSRF